VNDARASRGADMGDLQPRFETILPSPTYANEIFVGHARCRRPDTGNDLRNASPHCNTLLTTSWIGQFIAGFIDRFNLVEISR
jgi:hypothetical protein